MQSLRNYAWGIVAVAGLLAPLAAGAQDQPNPADQPIDLGPPPRQVAVLVGDHPLLSVTMAGEYGDVRINGTLDEAPAGTLRLISPTGASRDAGWAEIRSLSEVELPAEGFPAGSFRVGLVSDPGTLAGPTGTDVNATASSAMNWRLSSVPEGSLTLSGVPYGTLKVPTNRLLDLAVLPIRGSTTELPRGDIRVEILNGTVINVPLQNVQLLQRDQRNGTIAVTLDDDQMFTGKLVELPKVTISITPPETDVTAPTRPQATTIPLERITYLERTPVGGRRLM